MLIGNRYLPQILVASSSAPAVLITGMKWHIDANAISTLFQDAGGATPVTTDGQSVGLWKDRSAYLQHPEQSVGGYQPLYKTAIQNGLPVVRFDGFDDRLKVFAPVTTNVTTFEIFLVSKANAATADRIPLHIGVSTNGMGIAQYTATTGKKGFYLGGTGYTDASAAADTSWHLWLLRRTGGTTTLYDGGTAIASSASAPVVPTTYTLLGNYTNSAAAAGCDIGEALVYEGLSTSDVNSTANYLANKWGLSWTSI